MEDVIKLNRAATTVYAYEKIIENHITPAIGEVELQKLTPQHLQRYYAGLMREKGLSSNTVRKHHDLLNAALKMAVKQGVLLQNPAAAVEPPKVVRPEIHYYSMEDLERLFHLAEGTRLELLIKLAGYLGLRREEILGLTWDCVDLENRRLEVLAVRTAAGKDVVVKEPKTSTSRRVLHMPEDLVSLLKKTREQQLRNQSLLGREYQVNDYVVTHEDGRPVRPNYASELFVKFIRDHDLPPLTLHGLRHSFAGIANARGIPMYDIGKALGHSSPATTSKIYTHLLDQDHKQMLEMLWGTEEKQGEET